MANRTNGSLRSRIVRASSQPAQTEEPIKVKAKEQWVLIGDNEFTSAGTTVKTLPPGIYVGGYVNGKLKLSQIDWKTSDLYELPDTNSKMVLDSIKHFWSRRNHFKKRGRLFKRGILLIGPKGSGKTSTIKMATDELLKRNGIVIITKRPAITAEILTEIRSIEPERPIINIIEDIDEVISDFGETELLALLDGESQVDNIVHIATTNYPEELDERIINRPKRFDLVIEIGMPTAAQRATYLRKCCNTDELSERELKRWVKETDGMGISHLSEIIDSVFCLGNSFDETIARLRGMAVVPKGYAETNKAPIGFVREKD